MNLYQPRQSWRGHGLEDRLPYWYPTAEVDAQLSHVGWGAFITLFGVGLLGQGWCWVPLLLWAAPKEFVFDLLVERDSVPSSVVDFLFYTLGGLLGWGVWYLTR